MYVHDTKTKTTIGEAKFHVFFFLNILGQLEREVSNGATTPIPNLT